MNYHNITHDDMLNGDGLRAVLWVAGCEHQCYKCQNPITWDVDGGIEFDQNAKEELYGVLRKPYCAGITFSGGDPLHPDNQKTVQNLIADIKKRFPDKTIWLYTGYEWENIKHLDMIRDIDIIVDGKYRNDLNDNNLHWKGSSNQRVIDVQKSLSTESIVLYDE